MRTYSGLSASDWSRFQKMMLDVFYPLIRVPQGGSNIEVDLTIYSNWDLAAMSALLAIGVMCDEETAFRNAINYYCSTQHPRCSFCSRCSTRLPTRESPVPLEMIS
jgi:hypothetical protein